MSATYSRTGNYNKLGNCEIEEELNNVVTREDYEELEWLTAQYEGKSCFACASACERGENVCCSRTGRRIGLTIVDDDREDMVNYKRSLMKAFNCSSFKKLSFIERAEQELLLLYGVDGTEYM